jgi:hypothetical protein
MQAFACMSSQAFVFYREGKFTVYNETKDGLRAVTQMHLGTQEMLRVHELV